MAETCVSLIDHELIASAQEKLRAAIARHAEATATLAIARQKVKDAENASRLAIEGRSKISPLDGERALADAGMELRVAEKTEAAASNFLRKCQEWQPMASGIAHDRLYISGIKARIAAADKGDAARAMLAQADADHEAATRMLEDAIAAGHPNIRSLTGGPRYLVSAEAERARWKDHGIDLAAGTTEWAEYAKTQEPA